METKDIREIVEMMKDHDLCEFEMEDQGFRLALKRRSGAEPAIAVSAPPAAAPVMPDLAAAAPASSAPAAPAAKEEEASLLDIKSPIVGTFYRASSPDAEPYASVGQEVDEDTVVCIVEAMKVMNEIKAEVRGVIRKIAAENATPVQFGQVLFKVQPL